MSGPDPTTHTFSAVLWESTVGGSWVFLTVPPEIADEIIDEVESFEIPVKGFGSVKVQVEIGDSVWSTSLFPDAKAGSYVLPVKRKIRQQESLTVGDAAVVALTIEAPRSGT